MCVGGVTVYSNILVPLDSSKFSETVLPLVEALAKATSGKITFVMVGAPYVDEVPYIPGAAKLDPEVVTPDVSPSHLQPHGPYIEHVIERFTAGAKKYLEGAAGPVRADGVST